ncbi:FIG149030: hypothetical protein [hydrothermal vent metagenome]|uniref:DUF3375 domain-containing protein n=1 Tax=hydrothermal vent metagenome TaxID=652676 RepID=A0A3B0X2N5_9ZZZZ
MSHINIVNQSSSSPNTLQLRKHHPAWQLLAATKGPLMIAVLQSLFKENLESVEFDTVVLDLAQLLRTQQENGEIECSSDYQQEARREIRGWIKRGLLQERQGRVLATDALDSVLRFVQGLDQRIMSSSASRLAVVQREIEHLEASLNPNPEQREAFLKSKIAELEAELAQVKQGNIEVLPEAQAVESIREIYALSTSLSHDFRRVEDSYRDADHNLRESIIAEQNNRGEIVDKLLDSHEELLETPEGKVFNGFYQQLGRALELEKMKRQLRTIASHSSAKKALTLVQQSDLRWLIMRLVMESGRVLKARARSEKDVRGFLKTGLAAEHHRVGQLLNDVFASAVTLDWSLQKFRRRPSSLPPVALANNGLPLIERLRFKEWKPDATQALNLLPQTAQLDELDEDFWESFDGLNQQALFDETLELLASSQQKLGLSHMSIAEIARELPPQHDLEAIALWLSMAMASDSVKPAQYEQLEIIQNKTRVRFNVPTVALNIEDTKTMEFEV